MASHNITTVLWAAQKKTISQHPALCFATIKRPPKHLHLWSDPACDNALWVPFMCSGSFCHGCLRPGERLLPSLFPVPLKKPGRWGRQSPLKISGLHSLYLKHCSDRISLLYWHWVCFCTEIVGGGSTELPFFFSSNYQQILWWAIQDNSEWITYVVYDDYK